ncbi:trimeric autotransporter actin-nucleating factor BimA [Burkholderia pseudomallei]|uniref:trimeric autotransporter actin-nucleating factor BimA n=1 Tax=Burkholderia pseudomallei TaxID=28450 RepID=UPI0007C65D17|nr:trimeric autotransporter actin-nucleating factor BimA [Burkholderia pseudomallei]
MVLYIRMKYHHFPRSHAQQDTGRAASTVPFQRFAHLLCSSIAPLALGFSTDALAIEQAESTAFNAVIDQIKKGDFKLKPVGDRTLPNKVPPPPPPPPSTTTPPPPPPPPPPPSTTPSPPPSPPPPPPTTTTTPPTRTTPSTTTPTPSMHPIQPTQLPSIPNATPTSGSATNVTINFNSTGASAMGTNSIALDFHARAKDSDSLASGRLAHASGPRSTAIGAEANASGQNTVALGAGSIADRNNTVSVGRHGDERQIVHVAAGTQATDAVNVGQLNLAMSNANAYTNQRIGDLQQSITDTARDAYSGVAAATALTMIPDVDRDKRVSIGVGGAVYKGHRAVALGGTARINENLKVRAGVAMSAGGNAVGIGMSWQW